MSNANDFIIENGVLKKYVGKGGAVVIPNGVTEIGDNACSYAQIDSIVLPEGIEKIGSSAFSGNTFADIILPETLREIGMNAFGLCYMLEEITVPENVTKIGSKAFNHCEKLARVSVGDSVTSVGSEAFADTKFLNDCRNAMVFAGKVLINVASEDKEVVIPDGTVGIGGNAFGRCTDIEKIIVPGSVKVIGAKAFAKCKKLKWIRIDGAPDIAKDAIPADAVLIAKEMPVDTHKSNALKHQALIGWFFTDGLNGTAPENVIKYTTKNFSSIISDIRRIPELLERMLEQNAISVEQVDQLLEALQGDAGKCALLLAYKNRRFSTECVSESKTAQADKQLKGPTAAELKKLWKPTALPDGSVELSGYYGLETEVMLPTMIGKKQVTKIGRCCFYTSPSSDSIRKEITMISIPEGIVSIGDRAFVGCGKLFHIYMPATLNEIKEYAFWECPNVTIHAPAGSYAETYAKENNIPFVAE